MDQTISINRGVAMESCAIVKMYYIYANRKKIYTSNKYKKFNFTKTYFCGFVYFYEICEKYKENYSANIIFYIAPEIYAGNMGFNAHAQV